MFTRPGLGQLMKAVDKRGFLATRTLDEML